MFYISMPHVERTAVRRIKYTMCFNVTNCNKIKINNYMTSVIDHVADLDLINAKSSSFPLLSIVQKQMTQALFVLLIPVSST